MSGDSAGTATILTSIPDPDSRKNNDGADGNRDDSLLGTLIDKVGGYPYEFLLEVTPASGDAYQVTVRSQVPTKAEKVGMLQSIRIPPSLQVPVRIGAGNPSQVTIDWDAFLAIPDRQRLVREAQARAQAATIAKQQAADPGRFAALQAQNQSVAMTWAEVVRAGKMTRVQFEQNAGRLVQLGSMSRADYDAALARIDEP